MSPPLGPPALAEDAPEGAPSPLRTLVLPPLEAPPPAEVPLSSAAAAPFVEAPTITGPATEAPTIAGPATEAPTVMPPPAGTSPAAALSAAAPLAEASPLQAPPPTPAARPPSAPPLLVGAPPPYSQPGAASAGQQGNRRLIWWVVGGLGCLALIFFGACVSIGVLTLLGQRVSEGTELSATAATRDEGGSSRGTASASGELLLEDDFSDEMTSNLDILDDETSRSAYEDGVYVVEVKVPEMVVWSLVGGPYTDISVEVEAVVPPSSDVVAAGLIFHYQDNDNFYLYSVSNDGYYQLELLQDGEWITLIDPTLSDSVDGGRNTLRVETRGRRIALYVNGVLLEETADTTFTTGDAGLAVSTFEESTGTVEFDNLAIVRAE